MNARHPTLELPATPEHILSVLADNHRQAARCDPEVDRDAVLTPETTVAEWRRACDLLPARRLGMALNRWFGIAASDAEWRAVLEPAKERTLAGVCTFIASRAARPAVRPFRLLGASCLTGGVFLTVRSLLVEAGAPAAPLTPSAPLAPWARRHLDVFLGPISRLAPGALPAVKVHTPVYNAALIAFFASSLASIAGVLVDSGPVRAVWEISWVLSSGMLWIASRLLPSRVEFGDLRTFRDLARAIAARAEG
jgi:hypothetical protein